MNQCELARQVDYFEDTIADIFTRFFSEPVVHYRQHKNWVANFEGPEKRFPLLVHQFDSLIGLEVRLANFVLLLKNFSY